MQAFDVHTPGSAAPLRLLLSVCVCVRGHQGTGGECGLRGGYVEFCNIHPKTVEELYKICSINLSPNGVGQVRSEQGGGVVGNSREKPSLQCW